MDFFDNITRRLSRLPIQLDELGLNAEIDLLRESIHRSRPDRQLYEIVNDRLTEVENALLVDAFVEPPTGCGLDAGEIQILTTSGGWPVRVSFRHG